MTIADSTSTGSSSSIDPSRSESIRQAPDRASSVFSSPTSTVRTSSTAATIRMPMRVIPDRAAFTPKKRIIIRADPTLVSCFDPADKELYELWAPK